MKFCSLMYKYLYLDNYQGNIALCPWMEPQKACIGNLLKDKIEDAYNSEYANYLRSTMDDQSFRHCRPEACPYLQNNSLEEITPEEYESRKKNFYYPDTVNLAYDFVCNQSCETCRSKVFAPPKDYPEKMSVIREKIADCMDNAIKITASGHGDPFASKYMMEVLSNLRPSNPNMSLLLETNGVFFDEAHWEKIQHLSNIHIELVVTINSFDEFTYRHISKGGDYKKLMQNLDFMSKLRKEKKIGHLVNTLVIQDRNFREIPSFIQRSFADYAFDQVILRPVYQWGTMEEEVYWFKDVLNPLHPYHEEYLEIMQDPALRDPRVYHFGGNAVHVARPYPSCGQDKYFPYDKVSRNSRVIVYGAGQIGNIIVNTLKKNSYCKIIKWVDQCFDNQSIASPNCLLNMSQDEYDYIIVATINPTFGEEIRANLCDMGVAPNKIIFCKS